MSVVYDSIGKDTFPASLDCLSPRGLWVSFGNASGPAPPLDMLLLSQKGSLYATRPTLFTYAAKRDDLVAMVAEMFGLVSAGKIVSEPRQTFALKEAAIAHRTLDACDHRRDGASALARRVQDVARGVGQFRGDDAERSLPARDQRVRCRAVQAHGVAQRGFRLEALRQQRRR